MTLISLKQQHGQRISIFILMVLVVSLFQLCIASTSMATGYVSNHLGQGHISTQTISEKTLASDTNKATNHAGHTHDCCVAEHTDYTLTQEVLKSSCPECNTDEPFIHPLSSEFKSTFVLLYIVFEALAPNLFKHRHWLMLTEPRIYSSLPDIYLTKASFLE